jgi:hypothetical protein
MRSQAEHPQPGVRELSLYCRADLTAEGSRWKSLNILPTEVSGLKLLRLPCLSNAYRSVTVYITDQMLETRICGKKNNRSDIKELFRETSVRSVTLFFKVFYNPILKSCVEKQALDR